MACIRFNKTREFTDHHRYRGYHRNSCCSFRHLMTTAGFCVCSICLKLECDCKAGPWRHRGQTRLLQAPGKQACGLLLQYALCISWYESRQSIAIYKLMLSIICPQVSKSHNEHVLGWYLSAVHVYLPERVFRSPDFISLFHIIRLWSQTFSDVAKWRDDLTRW